MKRMLSCSVMLAVFLAGCERPKPAETDIINVDAGLTANLPYQPLQWLAITSSVDPTQHTMSTIFGNEQAVQSARKGAPYGDGAVLSEVTWVQRDDPHWFGARTPQKPRSVEVVEVKVGSDGKPSVTYQKFSGDSMQKQDGGASDAARRDAILGAHAAVMP